MFWTNSLPENLTLHHLILAMEYRPSYPSHLLFRGQIHSLFCERIRQVPSMHLSQLLKVTEGSSEIPVLAYEERGRERQKHLSELTAPTGLPESFWQANAWFLISLNIYHKSMQHGLCVVPKGRWHIPLLDKRLSSLSCWCCCNALHFNSYSYLQLLLLLGNRSPADTSNTFVLLDFDSIINSKKPKALTESTAWNIISS